MNAPAKIRKPTAKQVFAKIRPVESVNVNVHFNDAFRVNARAKFDGYQKQLGGRQGVFVKVAGQGDDIFAIPYTITADVKSKGEKSLHGALKTRGLEILTADQLK